MRFKDSTIAEFLTEAEKSLAEARNLWESLISHDPLFDMLDILILIAQIELRVRIKQVAYHYHFYGYSNVCTFKPEQIVKMMRGDWSPIIESNDSISYLKRIPEL